MIYDIDDWERPGHQTRALLQCIQIDVMEQYEGRAKSYVDPDAEFDFRYWEERELTLTQAKFRYRTDQVREARRTVETFKKRTFTSIESKNYIREFAKFERSVRILDEEGEDMIEYRHIVEHSKQQSKELEEKRMARLIKRQKKAEALEAIKKPYKPARLSGDKTYGQHLAEYSDAKEYLKKEGIK